MRVYPERLGESLAKSLAPVWIVGGDEPLLVEEAADAIRAAARAQEYSDREVFHVETGFEWSRLLEAGASLSLFSTRRIIELRMPKSAPGKEGSAALVEYCKNPPEDTVLLVICGAMDRSARESKWFKTLDKTGASVVCWPVEREKLPGWLRQRLQSRGLSGSAEAMDALMFRVEGNLLAAAQSIDRMALLFPGESIGIEQVDAGTADNARFDSFGLATAALGGNLERATRMLQRLQEEGIQPLAALNAILRDLRDVIALSAGEKTPNRLWPQREEYLRGVMRRRRGSQWQALLPAAARLDRLCKGQKMDAGAGAPWDELLKFVSLIAK